MPTPVVDPLASLSRLERWLPAGLLAGVGLLVAWNLHQDHRTITEGQREFAVAQANAVADTLQRELGSAVAGMRPLRDDIEKSPRASWPTLWARPVQGVGQGLGLVRALMLVDDAGALVVSSAPAQDEVVQALPELTRRAAAQADRTRVLTLAVPDARDVPATLLLATSLRSAEGQPLGVLAAQIDAAQLAGALRAVRHSTDTFVALAHGHGRLLALDTQRPVHAARNPGEAGSFFRRHLESGEVLTVMTGRPLMDTTEQMMVHRLVTPDGLTVDQPLVLALSRTLDAIYAPWRKHLVSYLALYGVLCLLTLASSAAIRRRRLELKTADAERLRLERQGAERLALGLDGADLALWDFDVASDKAAVNDRWHTMLGLPPQPVLHDKSVWRSLVHPDDVARVEAALEAHLAGRSPRYESTYRMRHRAMACCRRPPWC